MRRIVLGVGALCFLCGPSVGADVFPNAHYALPAPATAVVATDLDGDGRPELITSIAAPARIAVCPNLGNGQFGPPVTHALGGSLPPIRVFAADFDADGTTDIAAVCGDSGSISVSVLRGTGPLGFAASVVVPLSGGDPRDSAIGDIDADGRPDLVVIMAKQKSLAVLHGASAPAMFLAPVVHGPIGTPTSLAIGDVTGDGAIDIVLGLSVSTLAVVEPALGYASTWFGIGLSAVAMRLGDFDQDGLLDLAASGSIPSGGSQTHVRFGNGAFSPTQSPFGSPRMLPQYGHPGSLCLADFNGDARLDVAQGLFVRYVSFQSPIGSFEEPISAGAHAKFILGMAAADFDGDGRADLASVSTDGASVNVVLFTTSAGPAMDPVMPLGTPIERSLALADVDHDGLLDAVTLADTPATIAVHRSLGNGAFANAISHSLAPMKNVDAMSLGDLNSDGLVDAFVSTGAPTETFKYLAVTLGNAQGAFAPPQFVSVTAAYGINNAMGDIDLDGDLDIVEFWGGAYRVMRGNGTGAGMAVEPPTTIGASGANNGMQLADLNDDGILDMAFDISGVGTVATGVALGTGGLPGSPAFAPSSTYPVAALGSSASGTSIDVGDLDGDGKLDIAHALSAGSGIGPRVDVHHNLGNGTFGPAVGTPHGPAKVNSSQHWLVLRDIDADGHLDAIVSARDSWFSVLRGDGSGLAAAEQYMDAYLTGHFDVADVDGDATLDLIGIGFDGLATIRQLPGLPPAAPEIDSIHPAVSPAVGGVITIEGDRLSKVTALQFGTTSLGPTDFTILGDRRIQLVPPVPSALGPAAVLATNAAGTSAPGSFTYAATVPPRMTVPLEASAASGFPLVWGAAPGSIAFLVANASGASFAFQGLALLDPVIFLPLPALDAAGAGALAVPPFSVLSAFPLHVQLWRVDPPGTDTSTLTASARRVTIIKP